ncbi:Archaeal PaREP1/PaREP8 family [Pyrobaculum oguniense TE7]|uniref:Archaeal PaREP1/PaREP8 family n=1 Tax=Pyrobaculum oguniense (strain DSM 13380 / JCM 10595 / TE7) TaxID=698757 RepID=H6Q9V3_PYROT|nr:Archaeal PaREP1/PaREP8 family [Pyrobaculum oguniense TE7]
MDFPLLVKPWRDLQRYKEARLREAEVEARLALDFLEEGLVSNAAGKAFQAW